jgi:hypothetical protein
MFPKRKHTRLLGSKSSLPLNGYVTFGKLPKLCA